MKIENQKYQIIKLQTLKLYSEPSSSKAQKLYMQICFNKISNVLFEYSINSKKILFLGFPINFKSSLKNTDNKIIPEFIFFNGIISNRFSTKEIKKVNVHSISEFILLSKIKKLDLIVMFKQQDKPTILKESFYSRIPVIQITNTFNIDTKIAYPFLGDYKFFSDRLENNNFIIALFKTIMNRSHKNK